MKVEKTTLQPRKLVPTRERVDFWVALGMAETARKTGAEGNIVNRFVCVCNVR